MLTPEYLDTFLDPYLALVDQVNEEIVNDIARRLAETGTITATGVWEIGRVNEAGIVGDDVIKRISGFTNESEREIAKLFQEAGIENLDNDASGLLKAGIITASDVKLSESMTQILMANARMTAGDASNLTRTTASTAQSTYMKALNKAYAKVEEGVSYSAALQEAVREVAHTGTTVMFASGAVRQIDTAMRNSILTSLNQTALNITMGWTEEMGCNLVETTAHIDARPTHQDWQGQVFMVNGSSKEYPNLYDETGLGDPDGLGGYGCRHSAFPYTEGDARAYSQSVLDEYKNATVEYNGETIPSYEASQMQRGYERRIREIKRTESAYKAAAGSTKDSATAQALKAQASAESQKLKEAQSKLRDFCNQTGRTYDSARTYWPKD